MSISSVQKSDCCCLLLLLLLSCFSCVWLCDPIDGSPSGSAVPGILQARTPEWVALSFSNAWKWKVKVKLLSRVWLLATPRTAAYQASPSMGFSRQEYWNGVPLPSSFVFLRMLFKCDYNVRNLLSLTSHTQCNIFGIHPNCCVYQWFILFIAE